MADDDEFRARARAAVETGRLRWAAVRAVPLAAAAFAFASYAGCRSTPVATALAVATVAVLAGWKGRACLAGAVVGVVAALVPYLACHVACGSVPTSCSLCGVGGLVAGVVIAVYAVRRLKNTRDTVDVIVGACLGAAVHVAAGCAQAGVLEGLGLVIGVVVGAAPVLAFARRSLRPM